MSSQIDVSYDTPDYSGFSSPEKASEQKTKRVYPTLTIPNNMALAKAVAAGQEFTATVKFRVSEVRIVERADGGDPEKVSCYPGEGVRVEMEVHSIAPNGIKIEEGSNEEDGASAMKKFFKNKKKDADSDYDSGADDDSDGD